MSVQIKYTAACHKGKVREINQDNLWCEGFFLKEKNEGLSENLSGQTKSDAFPSFVVFDGLGGEQQGEVAAYIAAETFHFCCEEKDPKNQNEMVDFLTKSCQKMNHAICKYGKEKHIRNIGTTTAILMFGEDDILSCNLGDSRIYRLHKKKLEQISFDHVVTYVKSKKAPLSQHLGIPESEFMIEPFIARTKPHPGDRYLICSDGLTDMLTDKEIQKIIKKGEVSDVVEKLMDQSLENGGRDNITIILCEIVKGKKFQ